MSERSSVPARAGGEHSQPCDCAWCRFTRELAVTDEMVEAGLTAYTRPVGDGVKARAHVRAILEAALAGTRAHKQRHKTRGAA